MAALRSVGPLRVVGSDFAHWGFQAFRVTNSTVSVFQETSLCGRSPERRSPQGSWIGPALTVFSRPAFRKTKVGFCGYDLCVNA